jgi:hypothetical protein
MTDFDPAAGRRWIPVARRTFGMIKDVIMRDIGRWWRRLYFSAENILADATRKMGYKNTPVQARRRQ